MKNLLSSEKSAGFFKIFKISVLCAAGIATVLRLISLFLFYDADIGYYKSGSVLPTLFNVLIAISAIFILVSCIILTKNLPSVEKYTISNKCSAVFVALAFGVSAISSVFSFYSYMQYSIEPNTSPLSLLISIITIISPIVACAYFVLYALGKCSQTVSFAGGIFTLIYFVIILATSYFNIYIQMNAPEKLSEHLCCICALILILSEMRLMCGVEKKAFYLFSISFSAIVLISCALPTAIASFAGVFTEGIITPPDTSAYVFSALGVFSIVRLIMLEQKPDINNSGDVTEGSKETTENANSSIDSKE